MTQRRTDKKVSLTGYLSRQSNVFLVGLSAIGILLIALYDIETGFEVGFYIFYIVPICVTTWYVSEWVGGILAAVSVGLWTMGELIVGVQYSHPVVPYWNFMMRASSFLVLAIFLSKLKIAFDVQKRLSRTDHLTGITNRVTFLNQAALEIERSRRHKRPFTAAFVDIDNFKQVNDRFGHKKGDVLLRLVAESLKSNIRSIDVVARFGGDEFVLLLPETGAASAAILSRRLKERLTDIARNGRLPATFSFGVATFMDAPANAEEMVARADRLMYEAKRAGKNMIRQEIYHKDSR